MYTVCSHHTPIPQRSPGLSAWLSSLTTASLPSPYLRKLINWDAPSPTLRYRHYRSSEFVLCFFSSHWNLGVVTSKRSFIQTRCWSLFLFYSLQFTEFIEHFCWSVSCSWHWIYCMEIPSWIKSVLRFDYTLFKYILFMAQLKTQVL